MKRGEPTVVNHHSRIPMTAIADYAGWCSLQRMREIADQDIGHLKMKILPS